MLTWLYQREGECSLPSSARVTFSTNRLRSPPDILHFTSLQPPPSAYKASSAVETSPVLTFTTFHPRPTKPNQSSRDFQQTKMSLSNVIICCCDLICEHFSQQSRRLFFPKRTLDYLLHPNTGEIVIRHTVLFSCFGLHCIHRPRKCCKVLYTVVLKRQTCSFSAGVNK